MRALGVDLGARRIGIAVSDKGGVLASPLTVLDRSGSTEIDHQRIAALVVEEEAEAVVVGLPVDLRGNLAIAAQHALAEVAELTTVVGVPVHTHDERMTTAIAARSMRGAKDKKARIDKAAAAAILQSWLDRTP